MIEKKIVLGPYRVLSCLSVQFRGTRVTRFIWLPRAIPFPAWSFYPTLPYLGSLHILQKWRIISQKELRVKIEIKTMERSKCWGWKKSSKGCMRLSWWQRKFPLQVSLVGKSYSSITSFIEIFLSLQYFLLLPEKAV